MGILWIFKSPNKSGIEQSRCHPNRAMHLYTSDYELSIIKFLIHCLNVSNGIQCKGLSSLCCWLPCKPSLKFLISCHQILKKEHPIRILIWQVLCLEMTLRIGCPYLYYHVWRAGSLPLLLALARPTVDVCCWRDLLRHSEKVYSAVIG